MRYADIKPNDSINGEGICVSLFVQGCDNACEGCFNKETWDFNSGKEFTIKEIDYIRDSIIKNGIQRNFSVLGGEPMHDKNITIVMFMLSYLKIVYPSIKTYVWTGYTFEYLLDKYGKWIFRDIDTLIDGKFELGKKNITLKLRGSSNQRVIDVQKSLNENKIILSNIS